MDMLDRVWTRGTYHTPLRVVCTYPFYSQRMPIQRGMRHCATYVLLPGVAVTLLTLFGVAVPHIHSFPASRARKSPASFDTGLVTVSRLLGYPAGSLFSPVGSPPSADQTIEARFPLAVVSVRESSPSLLVPHAVLSDGVSHYSFLPW